MNGPASSVPVGVSGCLLGERVRYDGGHKAHAWIIGALGGVFAFRAFCPETAIGLGVPRPPMHLRRDAAGGIRCVQVDDAGRDHTDALRRCADGQASWLGDLCGYILKAGSPSCGMERVRVHGGGGTREEGTGLFAARMMERFPWLPVEEEGRLDDEANRESFILRVFALHRWRAMRARGLDAAALGAFHAGYKLVLMSRGQERCRALGRLASGGGDIEARARDYLDGFMDALKIRATRGGHVNALQHVQGHLKRRLDRAGRAELTRAIERYRLGCASRTEPLALLRRHFRRWPDAYIEGSMYMRPDPVPPHPGEGGPERGRP